MDIVDAFKARAHQALGRLQEIGSELAEELAVQQSLDDLQREFERLGADGELDGKERARLAARMKALGLDPSILEGEFEQVSSRFEDQVEDARAKSESSLSESLFLTRLATNQYATAIQAASYVNSERHRAYLNVINNLRA